MNRDVVTYTIQLCANSNHTPPVPSSCIALYFYELVYLLWSFDSVNLEIKQNSKYLHFLESLAAFRGVLQIFNKCRNNEQITNLCLH